MGNGTGDEAGRLGGSQIMRISQALLRRDFTQDSGKTLKNAEQGMTWLDLHIREIPLAAVRRMDWKREEKKSRETS